MISHKFRSPVDHIKWIVTKWIMPRWVCHPHRTVQDIGIPIQSLRSAHQQRVGLQEPSQQRVVVAARPPTAVVVEAHERAVPLVGVQVGGCRRRFTPPALTEGTVALARDDLPAAVGDRRGRAKVVRLDVGEARPRARGDQAAARVVAPPLRRALTNISVSILLVKG